MTHTTRDWKVQIVTESELVEITDLRIQFSIDKSSDITQNSLTISINNLSESTRSKIQESGAQLLLYLGYDDETSEAELVYAGDITTAFSKGTFPGTITTIETGDGNNASKKKISSISFAAGVTLETIINKLIIDIGLPKSKISGDLTKSFSTGFSFIGHSVAALHKVTKEAGLTFSIQNNEILILDDESDLENQAILLNANTGLLGSPELITPDKNVSTEKITLRVESLLNPKFHIGSKVQVGSIDYSGLFKVTNLHMEGDSHGEDWKTVSEVVAI